MQLARIMSCVGKRNATSGLIREVARESLRGAVIGGLCGLAVWGAYNYLMSRDADPFVQAIVEAECDPELAEECLSDVTINGSQLTVLTPCAHIFAEEEANEELYDKVLQERVHQKEMQERLEEEVSLACGDNTAEVTKEAKEKADVVIPNKVRVKRATIVNVTPGVEARATRVVVGRYRATYARRVLDECKSKFGVPEVSKANYRSVWRFAEQIMKDHGLRPSHRVQLLPYVVQLTFVPGRRDVMGMLSPESWDRWEAGFYSDMDYNLTRFEKWTRVLTRAFWHK
jgi:hypothetical protein